LIKVDGGVGCDLGTWVAESTADGTVLTRGDSGDEHHVEVISGHELDSHVFPESGGVGVSIPGDRTRRAFIVNGSRGWCNRYNVCAHKDIWDKS